jgi:putative nucleotidyltransferase with HDIG domain
VVPQRMARPGNPRGRRASVSPVEHANREVQGSARQPVGGLLRAGLSVLTLLLLASGVWTGGVVAYLAAGLALAFGALLALGRPRILARETFAHVAVDVTLVGMLVASTGGANAASTSYYFLVAAGIFWMDTHAKAALASAALVGGYALAGIAAGGVGSLGSARALVSFGILALLCGVASFAGSRVRSLRERADELTAARDREKERAEGVEAVISELGDVFEVLDIERMLQWTTEAAHTLAGGSYAHVAALYGNHHRSVAEGNLDYYPTWWHPSIQRLVLWCCREGVAVRSDEAVRGIEGFLAVPLGVSGGEKWGAIVVGGRWFGDEQERALQSLSAAVAPALERGAEEAPGGRDQISGLPDRESLRRVLRRELVGGRTLTVLAVGLGGLRDYYRTRGDASGNVLLRRLGTKLQSAQQRAFRYGLADLVVVLSGNGESRARRTFSAIRQLVSQETRGLPEHASLSVSAGYAVAEARGQAEPEALIEAALCALEKAESRPSDIVGADEGLTEDFRITGVVRSLVEALEAKDPHAGSHLRAVSRLSLQMAREMSLDGGQADALVAGALLHDVGKIGIPDHILHKPARLTEEEYETIKRHPTLGAEILAPVEELAPAVAVVRHHHERFDGKGYPDGLQAENIPLVARIVSVADAFDSMSRSRPYGYGVTQEAALEEIQKNAGTQFDPWAVRALLRVVEELGDRRLDSTG